MAGTPSAGLSVAVARTESGCGRGALCRQPVHRRHIGQRTRHVAADIRLRRMTCRRGNTRSRRAWPAGKITNSFTGDFVGLCICVIDVVVSRRSEPVLHQVADTARGRNTSQRAHGRQTIQSQLQRPVIRAFPLTDAPPPPASGPVQTRRADDQLGLAFQRTPLRTTHTNRRESHRTNVGAGTDNPGDLTESRRA